MAGGDQPRRQRGVPRRGTRFLMSTTTTHDMRRTLMTDLAELDREVEDARRDVQALNAEANAQLAEYCQAVSRAEAVGAERPTAPRLDHEAARRMNATTRLQVALE